MADIVISIVAKVAEYLVEPAIRQGRYFLCANKVIKDLDIEKKELTSERDSLQDRVEQAKHRTEEIEKPVEKWLNDVNNLLKEVANLEQRMRANTSCFQGRCPTWRRYLLCKQMVKKIEAMGKFKAKSNIQPFSHRAELPGIQYQSSENFTYFESTKVAYNQLLEVLQHDGISMIGVYAMGGSGKTTLVTEVGKKANELNLFDKVISITVSQTPNIRDIQGEMADMLNLKLEEESIKGRAQRLWLSLKEKKRILVIVDDLWRKFKLEEIGICLDNDNKGLWKVLITTRDEHVCDSMGCQEKIHLGLLSEGESWTLFQKHANIDDGFSKSLDDVPQKLCYECKGLPIAIAAVGSSLKGRSDNDWKAALHSLRHSEVINDHVEEGVRKALSCLKLSYDYLQNKEAQLLFLMCSMFPEDYNISIEDLIRYAVGVGQEGIFSLDSTRDEIRANINKLLQSCLLMHVQESKHYVKMHDMVRDTALWISKNHNFLFNLDKPLSALAEDDTIRDCFAVSSWYNENQIFCQLHAPNLEILLLNKDIYHDLDLSDAIFEGIQGLKVFSVINSKRHPPSLLSLPRSTQMLTNLRSLRLSGWQLGDISFIGSLTRLEVLDLRDCMFKEHPNEIGKLKRLKLLDLSGCHIPGSYNGAIGECSQLEELYFSGPIALGEYDCQSIVDIVTLPKLQRFVINTIYFGKTDYVEITRFLALDDFNISILKASKKNLLRIAEIVTLKHLHGGCKNIIPAMVGVVGGMKDLTSLSFMYCTEIECILDATSDFEVDALIPKLVKLSLNGMKNLKELCRGSPLQVLSFFEKLEELTISDCPLFHGIFPWECHLKNLKILMICNYDCDGHSCTSGEVLFSTYVAQSLQQLEELTIRGRHELKHIIASEREWGSNKSKEIVPTQTTSHFVMSNLKKVDIRKCRKLESIFQICHVEGQIQLPHLEVLTLYELENIIKICPENYGVKWPSLRELDVVDCPKLATSWIAMMVGSEQRQHLNEQNHLPSTLKRLELRSLPQLNLIPSEGPTPRQILSLQCLQHLRVGECENLKFLFSMEVHRSLPELISLKIYDCHELEQIIEADEELVQRPDAEVYFPKLTDIRVNNCNKLKSLFSVAMVRMLPHLSTLDLSKAAQLKQVFRHCSGDDTINEMELVLPNLITIVLYNLPSFVDICQSCRIRAMKLQKLRVHTCPQAAPSLREIQR